MKKDGTLPPKFIQTESKLLQPDTAKQEFELKKSMGY